jgi:predicted transcriptional regulator of viral defense system
MGGFAVGGLSSDAVLLWSALGKRSVSLLSVQADFEWLVKQTRSRDMMHRAVEQLAQSGRLRRLRRGVYHVAGMPDPTLLELLEAIHPHEPIRVSGDWAIARHLGFAMPPRVHVLRASQARSFTLAPRSVADTRRQLSVEYVRERAMTGDRIHLASVEQTVLDALSHPGWGVSMKTLRRLLAMLDQWPVELRPKSINDQRRLGLLAQDVLGQQLDWPGGASHATILLDPDLPETGQIVHPWNVRVNA